MFNLLMPKVFERCSLCSNEKNIFYRVVLEINVDSRMLTLFPAAVEFPQPYGLNRRKVTQIVGSCRLQECMQR